MAFTVDTKNLVDGFNSWADYAVALKKEFEDFKKEHSLKSYDDAFSSSKEIRDRYRELEHGVTMVKYKVEDEKKAIKKAQLEAQAKENGMGVKEMKVVNTLEKLKARINKNIEKVEKNKNYSVTLKNDMISHALSLVGIADSAWEEIKNLAEDTYTSYYDAYKKVRKNYQEKVTSLSDDFRAKYNRNTLSEDVFSEFYWDKLLETARDYDHVAERAEAKDMDERNKNRGEKKEQKEALFHRIRNMFYSVKVGETPVLTEFLDSWEKDFRAFWLDDEGYAKAKERVEELKALRNDRNRYHDYYNELARATSELGIYDMAHNRKEAFDNLVKSERDVREANFINSVYKYSGDIAKVSLYTDRSGNLNGIVEGTDGKKWNVNTIIAGGMIQRLHYRTLVHEIR